MVIRTRSVWGESQEEKKGGLKVRVQDRGGQKRHRSESISFQEEGKQTKRMTLQTVYVGGLNYAWVIQVRFTKRS
jgi:hypothetical protein